MRVRIPPCAKFSDGTTWKEGDWLKGSTNVLTKAHRETVLLHLLTLWLQISRLAPENALDIDLFPVFSVTVVSNISCSSTYLESCVEIAGESTSLSSCEMPVIFVIF
jgi:hypothetical protein